MSTAAVPDKRRRYVIAGGMVVLAVALGAVFGIVVARAISGYEITPLPAGGQTSVTMGDRDLAVWVSPGGIDASCLAVEDGTSRSSFSRVTNPSMSITDDSRSWTRLGLVDGDPGSVHALSCTGGDDAVIGFADNPRVLRYVVLGVVLGGAAALLMLSAFVLALVTALRRPPTPS